MTESSTTPSHIAESQSLCLTKTYISSQTASFNLSSKILTGVVALIQEDISIGGQRFPLAEGGVSEYRGETELECLVLTQAREGTADRSGAMGKDRLLRRKGNGNILLASEEWTGERTFPYRVIKKIYMPDN